MNIIIAGAGQVGFNLAKYLAEQGHDITVIDIDQKLINHLNDRLDVKAICGHGAHPDILKLAGADAADMLIAVTQNDEVNMVACEVGRSFYDIPRKIARIRSQTYLNAQDKDLLSLKHLSIDFAISPEKEVANAFSRGLIIPGVFDKISLTNDKITLMGIRCSKDSPVINTPITHIPNLFPEVDLTIIGLNRGGEKTIPRPQEILQEGDEVYLIIATSQTEKALQAFGYRFELIKRLVILGGGNVGFCLAQEIEKNYPETRVQVIEKDQERAIYIAQKLQKSLVLNGDALEGEVLQEANMQITDTVVAVTEDDRVNTLATILAKRLGAKKALCLANSLSFEQLVVSLGVDAAVNPRVVTVSKIMQYIRQGKFHSIHSLGETLGEVIDVEASVATNLIGKTSQEIFETLQIVIAALVQDDKVIIPRPTTVIRLEDRVILMMPAKHSKRCESILGLD